MTGNRRITTEEMAEHLKPRKSKYGVRQDEAGKLARTYNSVLYHSKAEMIFAQELDVLKMTGAIERWERQVPYPLVVNGVKIGKYVADYLVYRNKMPPEVIDVKPATMPMLATARMKIKLMLAIYGITVRIEKR